jgi:hypothetical protein
VFFPCRESVRCWTMRSPKPRRSSNSRTRIRPWRRVPEPAAGIRLAIRLSRKVIWRTSFFCAGGRRQGRGAPAGARLHSEPLPHALHGHAARYANEAIVDRVRGGVCSAAPPACQRGATCRTAWLRSCAAGVTGARAAAGAGAGGGMRWRGRAGGHRADASRGGWHRGTRLLRAPGAGDGKANRLARAHSRRPARCPSARPTGIWSTRQHGDDAPSKLHESA